MSTTFKRLSLVVLCVLAATAGFAQGTAPSSGFGFKMDLGIGVQTFNEPDPVTGAPTTTYQSLGFTPDISFGNFGIGIAVVLNYRFGGTANSLQIRTADWVPSPVSFASIAALYLPKIMYIRWGQSGDPLFIKFGSFNDGTLGDGFIMGDYDNTLFLPTNRHFGLEAGLDGNLFKFPFVGIEAVVGNVAALDVLGTRLYVRPLVTTQIPILSNLELGVSYVADTQPYLDTISEGTATTSAVSAFGADARVPVINVPNVATMLAFTDVASLQGTSWGGMLGVGGKLISIFTYGFQFRVLGASFIPDYFGPTYDLIRDKQYNLVTGAAGTVPASVGWLASIGTSFLNDKIIFSVSMDGPFTGPADPASVTPEQALLVYPHLRGILSLAEGVVPGITFDFSYDKKAIDTFASLLSAQDAAIQAQINFKSGPAVISFVYKIAYDPTQTPNPWNVTSGLQSSISLF